MLGDFKNLISLIEDSEQDILAEIKSITNQDKEYQDQKQLSEMLIVNNKNLELLCNGQPVKIDSSEEKAFIKHLQSEEKMSSLKQKTAYYLGLRDGINLLLKLNSFK